MNQRLLSDGGLTSNVQAQRLVTDSTQLSGEYPQATQAHSSLTNQSSHLFAPELYQRSNKTLGHIRNRDGFIQKLEQVMLRSEPNPDKLFALIRVDLSGLCWVRNVHGEPIYKKLMQGLYLSMRGVLHRTDVLARFSESEFSILIAGTKGSPQQLKTLSNWLLTSVSAPVELRSLNIQLSASLGSVFWTAKDSPKLSVDRLLNGSTKAVSRAATSASKIYLSNYQEI